VPAALAATEAAGLQDNRQRFFVAVIGGLWQLNPTQAEEARRAGEALGRELARAGFGLVVYFSNAESLEPHVVAGFVAATPGQFQERVIRMRYPASLRGQVRFAEQDVRPELFDPLLFPGDDWEAPFYQSLSDSEGLDAVVLLAGATATLIAGQIAVARRLPILAIDTFGGSAAKVWSQLAHASPGKSRESWGARPSAELVGRLREECQEVARTRAEEQRGRRQLTGILEKRNQAAYAVGAAMPLLAALGLGTAAVTAPAFYTAIILIGLLSAGAVGAAVRTILSEQGTADPRTSLLLGGIAGLVVGLTYLIPQWIGAPGPLTPGGTTISATDRIQFVSSIIVAVSAGVGFDTIFNRMRKQAEDARIDPSQGRTV
jgi:hypothetical protein